MIRPYKGSIDSKLVFHIGFHKTGTSYLQNLFFPMHPEIQLISNSVSPWDDPFLQYLIKTDDNNFDPVQLKMLLRNQIEKFHERDPSVYIVSAERLSGHPASGGYDRQRIAYRIHECFPESRIICVVRNQTDMIYSLWRQMLVEGYCGKLNSFLKQSHWKTIGFGLNYLEYDHLICTYYKLFGEKRVCVLCYELMKKDLLKFLDTICDFLNLEYRGVAAESIIYKSIPIWGAPILRFINHFRKTELNPFPIFNIGTNIPKGCIYILKKLNFGVGKMDKKLQDLIREYYQSSNLRLLSMVDRDLTLFKRKVQP